MLIIQGAWFDVYSYGVTGVNIREIWVLILVNILSDSTDTQKIITM